MLRQFGHELISLAWFGLEGYSFDSKSAVPDSYFWAGTSTFQENLIKLHSGTPTFFKKCLWDSYFENPCEIPA